MSNKTPTKRHRYTPEQLDMAVAAIGFQSLSDAFGRASVLCALCTGVVLMRAKDALPHGQFDRWIEDKVPGISRPTAARYLALAQCFRESVSPQRFRAVTKLAGMDPKTITPDVVAKEVGRLDRLIDGRTLTDLYRGFGIIPPKPSGAKALPEALEGNKADPMERATKEAKQCVFDFTRTASWALESGAVDYLEPEEREQAVGSARAMLEALTGKKVVLQ